MSKITRAKSQYRGEKNICHKNVRKFRLAKGMTQKELSERCKAEGLDIGENSISLLELGERNVSDYELFVIARVLEVEPEDLITVPKSLYD